MRLTGPVGPAEFDQLMAGLGPFESVPHIAVGLSGGADSMALTLLLANWVAARSGRLLALTLDHGLRADSGVEAMRVARWMHARGIDHRILAWAGPKPATGIQAGARTARLHLLSDAAATSGMLHLALAHHADDQAETHHLRAQRSSAGDGLAGMPAIRELPQLRLIRPLLPVAKARLAATCAAAGQDWVEDPSNRNPEFARAHLRLSGAVGTDEHAAVLAAGHARAAADDVLAAVMAACVRFQPEGWALVDREDVQSLAVPMRERLFSALLRAIGGAAYPPSPAAVADLVDALVEGGEPGRTLAGCQVTVSRGDWRLTREVRNLQGPVTVIGGGPAVTWDGRFRLSIRASGQFQVRAVDPALWRVMCGWRPDLAASALPAVVRNSVPVILGDHGPIAAPHLGFLEPGVPDLGLLMVPMVSVPACGARFAVVSGENDII